MEARMDCYLMASVCRGVKTRSRIGTVRGFNWSY